MKRRFYIPDFVLLIICVAPLLLLYVSIYLKIYQVGYQIEKVKKEYEELNFINKTYEAEILKLTSFDNLKDLSKKFGLELTIPERWCYVDIEKINSEKEKISDEVCAETR